MAMSRPSASSAGCRGRCCMTTPGWRWRASFPTARGSGRGPLPGWSVHYAYKDRFGRPGRGNDKGKVEALVKHARRAFLTPVPWVASFAALNAELERQCLARLRETAGRDPRPVGERLNADLAALMRLPAGPFEACDIVAAPGAATKDGANILDARD